MRRIRIVSIAFFLLANFFLPAATQPESASFWQRTNHWAYQPPRTSSPPPVKNESWPRGEIDRFILARLEEKNLLPGPDAARSTLARRASFDLTGLPPEPGAVDAFLRDPSPEAYARWIDRLMASPQFGERWGRHWLDVARFGESVTLRGLIFKEAWRYRDYVIDTFNRDLPYNQFIQEQIAGDLLPAADMAARQRQVVATTFLALGNANLEEQDKAQLRMDVVDEQLDTIGKAFLAQTIGCARCHDHKFDPIPARDYYAMAGILRSTRTITNANVSGWMELPLPLDAHEEELYARHENEMVRLAEQLKSARAAAQNGHTAAQGILAARDLPGIVVDNAQAKVVGDWKHSQYSKHYIGDGYFHDDNQGKGSKTLTFIPELKTPGRYEVRLAYVPAANRSPAVPVTIFHADGETTVRVNERETPGVEDRFVSLGQFRFEGNGFGYALISTEGTQGYVTADAVQFLPVENLQSPAPARGGTPPDAPSEKANREIKRLEEALKKLQETGPGRPRVMSVLEENEPGDTFIHLRGSVHNPGEIVPRGLLRAANSGGGITIPPGSSGRLQLARWIGSDANTLAARVMVNRIWHWLFGAGLVRTTDNFGSMGEAPSHPELLDYLAVRFAREGWSVKRLIREIMLSRVYQLDSAVPAGSGADPENRWLAHFNRRRLDAECIRDAMLWVSGELDLSPGGPTIRPGTAADYGYVFADLRRSVYVPVLRNALPEIFEVFDFADPSIVTGVRNLSTVAPQSLFLMNHPMVGERARHAAARLVKEAPADNPGRMNWAYRLALGRAPTPGESAASLKFLAAQGSWEGIFHALFASVDFRHLD